MAVDKKSQHYTSAQHYKDNDGNMKSFTMIDHDKKSKASRSVMEEGELEKLKQSIKDFANEQVDRILLLPAVNAIRNPYGLYEEFIIRDQKEGIIWDENVVREACSINHELARMLLLQVWRTTVKEMYWFEELSIEEMKNEKWREWM